MIDNRTCQTLQKSMALLDELKMHMDTQSAYVHRNQDRPIDDTYKKQRIVENNAYETLTHSQYKYNDQYDHPKDHQLDQVSISKQKDKLNANVELIRNQMEIDYLNFNEKSEHLKRNILYSIQQLRQKSDYKNCQDWLEKPRIKSEIDLMVKDSIWDFNRDHENLMQKMELRRNVL